MMQPYGPRAENLRKRILRPSVMVNADRFDGHPAATRVFMTTG